MPRSLAQPTLTQMFLQESSDPFLMLITITHPDFATIRLVNNNEDITFNGNLFTALAMKIVLPTDDGESVPKMQIALDNVPLELIDEFRSTTTPATVMIEAILASTAATATQAEITIADLAIGGIDYNNRNITANLVLNDFLNQRIPGEVYSPQYYPGMFT